MASIPTAETVINHNGSDRTKLEALNYGLTKMQARYGQLSRIRQHWLGQQPAAYLSQEAARALDRRLHTLAVNFPRLVTRSLTDRIHLAGITHEHDGGGKADQLWSILQNADLTTVAGMIHTDRALYGTAYATVWSPAGELAITCDSPWTMTHVSDPATGRVRYAVRSWFDSDAQRGYAALLGPDEITLYRTKSAAMPSAGPNWETEAIIPNGLGVCPVVPFIRRVSSGDPATGASVIADVLDLSDAVAKLLGDAMVTSEYYARPRRWATGLELMEDEQGRVVDPFANSRFLQSESPETKFGQLPPSPLDGYSDLVATLTQQIGALTGLPATYLGLHGDQPASADAVKASEVQLTMQARVEQQQMAGPWRDVVWLADSVAGNRPAIPETRRPWGVVWQSPEIRTQAQAADAAQKLRELGIPLQSLLEDPLGYAPDRAARIAENAETDLVLASTLGNAGMGRR